MDKLGCCSSEYETNVKKITLNNLQLTVFCTLTFFCEF
jgi:hypothetical protein